MQVGDLVILTGALKGGRGLVARVTEVTSSGYWFANDREDGVRWSAYSLVFNGLKD